MQILGASFDTVNANKRFAAKQDFPFLLLCDTARVLGSAYGAGETGNARRITYLIDEDGMIMHTFDKVDTATHAQEVLALLH